MRDQCSMCAQYGYGTSSYGSSYGSSYNNPYGSSSYGNQYGSSQYGNTPMYNNNGYGYTSTPSSYNSGYGWEEFGWNFGLKWWILAAPQLTAMEGILTIITTSTIRARMAVDMGTTWTCSKCAKCACSRWECDLSPYFHDMIWLSLDSFIRCRILSCRDCFTSCMS